MVATVTGWVYKLSSFTGNEMGVNPVLAKVIMLSNYLRNCGHGDLFLPH